MLDLVLPALLLLLPLAVWSGYRAGIKSSPKNTPSRISKRYITGLNYLLNEEPDKAIDAFIELLQVDSETVETHLALGNLFRKRGEVDRAIRIHQNLIARPALTGDVRKLALRELAHDYMAAGLFDRAENLFKELVNDRDHRLDSLNHLVIIYQQIKDWSQAIDVSRQIANFSGVSQSCKIAHYYCEVAEDAKQQGNLKLAHESVQQALSIERSSVRASIIQGRLYHQTGKYKKAIKSFRKIRHQDIAYLPEVIAELINCFQLTGNEAELVSYLKECLNQGAGVSVLLALSELLQTNSDEAAAAKIISEYLRDKPSLKGLEQLIQIHIHHANGPARENLQLLHDLVLKLIKKKPVYRCDGCGYSGKTLFWQCPSCKDWGTIKPIFGIEGE